MSGKLKWGWSRPASLIIHHVNSIRGQCINWGSYLSSNSTSSTPLPLSASLFYSDVVTTFKNKAPLSYISQVIVLKEIYYKICQNHKYCITLKRNLLVQSKISRVPVFQIATNIAYNSRCFCVDANDYPLAHYPYANNVLIRWKKFDRD